MENVTTTAGVFKIFLASFIETKRIYERGSFLFIYFMFFKCFLAPKSYQWALTTEVGIS